MENQDGAVIISTELDNAGVAEGLKEVGDAAKGAGRSLAETFKNATINANQTRAELEKVNEQIRNITDAKMAEGIKLNPNFSDAQLKSFVKEQLNADTAYQRLNAQAGVLNQNLRAQEKAAQKAFQSLKNPGMFDNAAQSAKRAENAVRKTGSAAVKTNRDVTKSARSIGNAGKSAHGVFLKLGTVLKGLLIGRAVKGMARSVQEGLKDLAQVSAPLNTALSGMETSFLQLRNSVVSAVAPAIIALAPIIESVTGAIVRIMGVIGQLTAALFTNASTYKQAQSAAVDYAAKVSSGNKKAEKSVERVSAAFDNLNVLSAKKDEGGALDVGTPNVAAMWADVPIDKPVKDFADRVRAKLGESWQRLSEIFGNIDFTRLLKSLSDLWNAIKPVLDQIYNGVFMLIETHIAPLIKKVVEDWLPRIADALSRMFGNLDLTALFESIDSLMTAIEPFIDDLMDLSVWLIDELLAPIGEWVVNEALPKFFDLLASVFGALHKAVDTLKPGLAAIWEEVIKPMGQWAGEKFTDWIQFLTEKWDELGQMFEDNKELINECLTALKDALKSVWNFIRPILDKLYEGVKETVNDILTFVKKVFPDILNVFKGAFKIIDGIFSGDFNKVVEGFKDIFKGGFNFVISLFEAFANKIIEGVNGLISNLNKIHFELPDWIPGIGGKSFGINIPSIPKVTLPKLAKGAVIPANREFMAVLGDQKYGTNIETPVALLENLFQKHSGTGNAEVAALLKELTATVRGLKLNFSLNGREIARDSRSETAQRSRMLGNPV